MKALIDGDILVYRAAFAAESTVYTAVDPDGTVQWNGTGYRDMMASFKERGIEEVEITKEKVVEPLVNALGNAKLMMETILEGTKATDYALVLSTGDVSFRHLFATVLPYKANRKDMVRPVHYEEVRQYLIDKWDAVVFNSVEADDIVALLQEQAEPGTTAICSIDKDLLQVEGYHYHIVDRRLFYQNEYDAALALHKQILIGDSTDNIPGIYGIGEKRAQRLLLNCSSVEEMQEKCADAWYKYFKAKTPKPEGMEGKTADEVRHEVTMLVTVGGTNATEAIEQGGETEKAEALQISIGS